MILDYVALGSIIFLAIGITAAIVVTGSLPGKIARQKRLRIATMVQKRQTGLGNREDLSAVRHDSRL